MQSGAGHIIPKSVFKRIVMEYADGADMVWETTAMDHLQEAAELTLTSKLNKGFLVSQFNKTQTLRAQEIKLAQLMLNDSPIQALPAPLIKESSKRLMKPKGDTTFVKEAESEGEDQVKDEEPYGDFQTKEGGEAGESETKDQAEVK
jgi:histone H3/H4